MTAAMTMTHPLIVGLELRKQAGVLDLVGKLTNRAIARIERPFAISKRQTKAQEAFRRTVQREATTRAGIPVQVRYTPGAWSAIEPTWPTGPGKSPTYNIGLDSTSPMGAAHEIGHGANARMVAKWLGQRPLKAVVDSLYGTGHHDWKGLDQLWALRTRYEAPRRLLPGLTLSYRDLVRSGGMAAGLAYSATGGDNPWLLGGLPYLGYVPSLISEGAATIRGLGAAGKLGMGFGKNKLPLRLQARSLAGLLLGTASYALKPTAAALLNVALRAGIGK